MNQRFVDWNKQTFPWDLKVGKLYYVKHQLGPYRLNFDNDINLHNKTIMIIEKADPYGDFFNILVDKKLVYVQVTDYSFYEIEENEV